MTIGFVGSLPVSAVNVGLNASLVALDVEIGQLTVDLSGLAAAGTAQIEVSASFPPNVPAYTAALGATCNPLEVGLQLTPGIFSVNAAPLAVDAGVELGLVEAKLAAALAISEPLEAGLAVGGIAGWSYAGTAKGFGDALQRATAGGFGRTAADTQIQATILATENPVTWLGLGSGFHTGAPSPGLHYLGQLGASEWSFGLGTIMARLRLFLLQLRGLKATLEYQIQFCLGLEMPDVDLVVDTGLDVIADLGIDGLLDALVNINIELDASIAGLQARIDALLALQLSIAASLSGGGLAVWTYAGPASLLGVELQGQITNGVPGGNGPGASINGLVVAASPVAMGTFGSIFLV